MKFLYLSHMSLIAVILALFLYYEYDHHDEIVDAMSAAPYSISKDATIVSYPDGPELNVLQEGTNGWLCMASSSAAIEAGLRDSACFDEVWQGWFEAFMAGEDPEIDRIGFSYMLQGDAGASNVDPFATGPEDDPTWHVGGPHIMILLPDYTGIPTDYEYGGPYVMWADTPYAHVMMPVEDYEDH